MVAKDNAMKPRVCIDAISENVQCAVMDICIKFHTFTTIWAIFAPVAQTTSQAWWAFKRSGT